MTIKRVSIIALITVGVVFLLAVSCVAALSDAQGEASGGEVVSEVPVAGDALSVPTESPVTVEPQVSEPEPVGFTDGTYEIGTGEDMMPPGKYKTAGPDEDSFVGMCYWARLSGLTGELGDIKANDNISGPTTIVIKENDVAFETNGCQPWAPVS